MDSSISDLPATKLHIKEKTNCGWSLYMLVRWSLSVSVGSSWTEKSCKMKHMCNAENIFIEQALNGNAVC